jgi:type I restriction enzyme M protein
MVSIDEIADPKNDYNLNLPRYIDTTEPEDLQDINGHLCGGIPERDIDDPVRLKAYWDVLPSLRAGLFKSAGRPGYLDLSVPIAELKQTIYGHAEFTAFQSVAIERFNKWKQASRKRLIGFDQDGNPKVLIETLSVSLLAAFKAVPLVDPYDAYQRLMDFWDETMQDDCYIIAASGWKAGALPHEIFQTKNKDNKLVWAEVHDYTRGKRRFKSDLIPVGLLVDRYFATERDGIAGIEAEIAGIEQQLDEKLEEGSGEDGLLAEVIEGEDDKRKITPKAIKARLKEIGKDADFANERQALEEYNDLLDQLAKARTALKAAQDDLERKIDAKYPTLTLVEIQTLVVDDKWFARITADVNGELDRVSQTLRGRVRQLAERYAAPLPQIMDEIEALAAHVDVHLEKMGVVWK